MAGIFHRMLLANGPFYIQPELLYTQKGFKQSFEGTDITFALDYITLNVLFYTTSKPQVPLLLFSSLDLTLHSKYLQRKSLRIRNGTLIGSLLCYFRLAYFIGSLAQEMKMITSAFFPAYIYRG